MAERAMAWSGFGKYTFPERFAWSSPPAWSPDGSLLACAVEGTDRSGFFVHLVTIDAETGEIHTLGASRWQGVQHMSWLGGESALGCGGPGNRIVIQADMVCTVSAWQHKADWE